MTDWNVIFFRKNRTKNHASTWKPIRPCIHVSLQSTAAANAVRHMYQPHIASHQVRVNLYPKAIRSYFMHDIHGIHCVGLLGKHRSVALSLITPQTPPAGAVPEAFSQNPSGCPPCSLASL